MDAIKCRLKICQEVVKTYENLLNSSILDFYVENLWETCLPPKWQQLEAKALPTLSVLLEGKLNNGVYPLSIVALKKLSEIACIKRTPDMVEVVETPKELKRRVKPKKRHEIAQMSEICTSIAAQCKVESVIDFGSGLGHLSRNLALCGGLNVCCIEGQNQLSEEARKLDDEIRTLYFPNCNSKILHINTNLNYNSNFKEILSATESAFASNVFGLIGLHPCGDLAVLLLKNFLKHPEVRFIHIVGCCYMKITLESKENIGYPLSTAKHIPLTYGMLEVACHANEKYANRLKSGDYNFLKVHSFRAAIEKIIVRYRPDLKHSGLKSMQYSDSLTFEVYCKKALENMDFIAPEKDVKSKEIVCYLNDWKRIVIYYTLKLMLAPFVESIVLYDRKLYLMENGCKVTIFAAFDPIISPRCHITSAIKTPKVL